MTVHLLIKVILLGFNASLVLRTPSPSVSLCPRYPLRLICGDDDDAVPCGEGHLPGFAWVDHHAVGLRELPALSQPSWYGS